VVGLNRWRVPLMTLARCAAEMFTSQIESGPGLKENPSAVTHIPLIIFLFLSGCHKPAQTTSDQTASQKKAATSAPWFREVSASANLSFHHTSGHDKRFLIPEMETGGVGLLDFDGDGLLDIYCVQAGSLYPNATNKPGNKLFRNLGNWKFEDVTQTAGVGDTGYGMGCCCADYDNDGRIDIYVTNLGRNVLYHNNGNGTFTDVTESAGVGHRGWGTSCAFVDYDGDGNLDLVVANYLNWSIDREIDCFSRGGQPDYCSPMNYRAPAMDTLYHNIGGGRFEDVTIAAGLDKAYGNGLGVVCADFDKDGKPDILIANDAMPNQLWMNKGNGKFADEAVLRGCAVNRLGIPEAGMGIVAVDIFQRGWLDVFVTHLVGEGNRLFVNTNGYFMDVVPFRGPETPSMRFTAFGVGFADFDNDGVLDLYVGNGGVKLGEKVYDPNDPYAEPNTLLRGLGNGQFEEILPQGGTEPSLIATSRGVALGDFDNDGGIDVVIINKDGPAHLLKNLVAQRGHWIMFRVLNANGTDAIGASVKLEAAGKTQWRQAQPNQGYCSSNDPRVHFGLAQASSVERVTVQWPDGTSEIFGPFQAGRIFNIKKGAMKTGH